jgi:small subunit ribosomal protein S6
MKSLAQYELIYVVAPDVGDEKVSAVHEEVVALVARFDGRIVKTENWGRRRLAYEIKRHTEGTYTLELIEGSGEMLQELDRRLRVLDQVMRHLVVRIDRELNVAERARTRRKRRVEKRRVTRGLPAEPESVTVSEGDSGIQESRATEAEG